jgi:hypothetical protein
MLERFHFATGCDSLSRGPPDHRLRRRGRFLSDEPQVEPQAVEPTLPAYVIEGARSSRSKCKFCRRRINHGTLRIGFLIEGPYGTGYLWHHLTCAARRRFDSVEEAYAVEAWRNAKDPPDSLPELESLRKLHEQAVERKISRKVIPYAEIAPSGRSRCKHCEQLIEKGSLRVILGRGVYFGSQVRTAPINIHPECVSAAMKADECTTEVEDFAERLRKNTADLSTERIDALLARIGDLT